MTYVIADADTKSSVFYSKDASGNIITWYAYVIKRDDGTAVLIINTGRLNNERPIIKIIKEGKNIGKSNETTPHQEAVTMMNRKVTLKKRNGYKTVKALDIDVRDGKLEAELKKKLHTNKTDDLNNLKPMKAKPYKDGIMRYPALAQRKINGYRCTIRLETIKEGEGMFAQTVTKPVLRTKEGHRYLIPHIEEEFIALYETLEDKTIAFDGELYIHGKLLADIKKHLIMLNSKGRLSTGSMPVEDLSFYCFDLSIAEHSQEERILIKDRTLSKYPNELEADKGTPIVNLLGEVIVSDSQCEGLRDTYLDEGYEGLIIRDLSSEYKFGGRQNNMLKLKRWITKEFEIVDVVLQNVTEDVNIRSHIVFVCKNDVNDNTFETVPMGNEKDRQEYLTNKDKYIGKLATVKFTERTNTQCPFHSNAVDIARDEMGDLN